MKKLFLQKDHTGVHLIYLLELLSRRFSNIQPDRCDRAFEHPGMEKAHVIVCQKRNVKITMTKLKAAGKYMADLVAQLVHLRVCKTALALFVYQCDSIGKPLYGLSDDPAHVDQHYKTNSKITDLSASFILTRK